MMRRLAAVFACALLAFSCSGCDDNDGGGDGWTRLPEVTHICASGSGAYAGSFRVADEVLRWTGSLPHEREVAGSGRGLATFTVQGGNTVCAWEDRDGCDFMAVPPSRADCGQTAEVRVFL